MKTSREIITELIDRYGYKLDQLKAVSNVSSPTLSRVQRGVSKDMMYEPARKLESLLDSLKKKRKGK